MINNLIMDMNGDMPIGLSICDKDGNFLKVHNLFNKVFNNNNIKSVSDIKELDDIFNSDKIFNTFHIKLDEINRYYRLDKVFIDNYYVILLSDITLLASEYNDFKLSKYTIDNNILPILWIKGDGEIVYHNQSATKYIGEDNILGKKIYRLASDIKKSDWNKLWDDLHINHTKEFIHRFYNKKEDNIYTLRVVSNLAVYYDWEYCYMVISDITELVDSTIKLQKEKQKAIDSERLKDLFLSNMSHEIRTPMNAIVGFSEIIHENVDPSLKEYTKIITENVDYLLSLIDNIITISKLDSNQVKVKYDNFNVLDMLEDIHFKYDTKLKKNKKDVVIILDNDKDYLINSDKYIIEECLNRLIDNSIKFTEKGFINMGYDIKSDDIIFYIKDTGIGVDNKYHNIIFDRFRQVERTTMGSGLGLAIFDSYIGLMNGKYNIVSDVKNGIDTKVSFILKIDGLKEVEKMKIYPKDLLVLNNKKILIAEDMDVNQIMLYDILMPYKVNIIKAVDGRECVEKFVSEGNIDLILMDLDMPDIDGYEASKIIRTKDKEVPIIVQTAYAQKENRERAKKIGINDFITKPINKENLIRIIIKNIK